MAGIGWLASCSLAITAMVNAPFRDAAMGLSLLILAAALSSWPADREGAART
jgi:hypothetical protein